MWIFRHENNEGLLRNSGKAAVQICSRAESQPRLKHRGICLCFIYHSSIRDVSNKHNSDRPNKHTPMIRLHVTSPAGVDWIPSYFSFLTLTLQLLYILFSLKSVLVTLHGLHVFHLPFLIHIVQCDAGTIFQTLTEV